MLCLPNYTYHRLHQNMCKGGRHGAKGGRHPQWETILTDVKLCAPSQCLEGENVNCGVATVGYHLRWKAVVFYRTSSQIWDSWNLPRFLLRNRSLTLMNIASLVILAVLCTSLPTIEKLSTMMQYPQVLPC